MSRQSLSAPPHMFQAQSHRPPVVIITGPTGSGKTAAVQRLAAELPLTIISADSRQIIRGFDIGSAKPSQVERERYDYRLLDLIQPGEGYSAFRFKEDAEREIKQAPGDGRIPILCGGTGLYLRALVEGIFEIPTPEPGLRQRMAAEAERLGPEGLHAKLRAIDPLEAEVTHANNVVRVQRALEIYYITGKTKSELALSQRLEERPYRYCQLALAPPIAEIYAQIERRVDEMFERGWLAETERLITEWGSENILAAKAIGYTEIVKHVNGLLSLPAAIELIKQNTRRFAKRQMTWLRGVEGLEFFSDSEALINKARRALKEPAG